MAAVLSFTPDSPAVIAHINLLQGIINRLAGASASCKTWCIALVAALLSLAGTSHLPGVTSIALVPVIIFGFLDTSYLAQERAYRDLFKAIVVKIHNGSYGVAETFVAGAPLKSGARLGAVFSWSILPIYLGLIVLYGVAYWRGWLELLARH
jgi:hypothetical protein